jgi:hypothetical protein
MKYIFLRKKSLTRICTHPSSLKAGRKTRHAPRLRASRPKVIAHVFFFHLHFYIKLIFREKTTFLMPNKNEVKIEDEITENILTRILDKGVEIQ